MPRVDLEHWGKIEPVFKLWITAASERKSSLIMTRHEPLGCDEFGRSGGTWVARGRGLQ
jgi:hypothetical protein